MRQYIALLVCALCITVGARAQGCLPEGIVLNSQAQVNSFPQNYPGCTTIEGYLRISAGAVTNLAPLSQITAVNGYLHVGANPQLTNLAGLQNITSVGGPLTITGNAQLNNLSGLAGITAVGGLMEVSGNNNLTSLAGLHSITSVGGYLEISDSPGLIDLQGLEGLGTIGDDLILNGNATLTSMQGLSPSYVGGGFSLMNNPQLMDLSAASGLTSLGGVLSLIGNTAILSLDELSGITAVNGLVRVTGSSGLMSLNGLRNIAAGTILNLIIANNPGLFQCAVESLCDYLEIPSSMANITGNATGCASRAEVEAACMFLSVDKGWQKESPLTVFPNPTDGPVLLRTDLYGPIEAHVFDQAGRPLRSMVMQGMPDTPLQVDLGGLAPGAYMIQLRTKHGTATRMVVRE